MFFFPAGTGIAIYSVFGEGYVLMVFGTFTDGLRHGSPQECLLKCRVGEPVKPEGQVSAMNGKMED